MQVRVLSGHLSYYWRYQLKASIKKEDELERIENNYTYHAPKQGQPDKYESIRSIAKGLALVIYDLVPDSREKSLAMTKLEEAVMWANAGIARN